MKKILMLAFCLLTVVACKKEPVHVVGVTLDQTSLLMEPGESQKLKATIFPDNAENKNVKWESKDTGIVSVDANGTITAISDGTTTVSVVSEDGGKTASCKITVKTPVSGISLDVKKLELTIGETYLLQATIIPDNAGNKELEWKSTDESVASVNSSGEVTAISTGTAAITVTTKDGGKSATCVVTVKSETPGKAVTSISVSPESIEIIEGNTAEIKVTVLPEDAENKNIVWLSTDEGIATVDNGKVKAINSGTTEIIAISEDGNHTARCSVKVLKDLSKGISGKWYLGYYVYGASLLHFDGTEYMSFNGDKMDWMNKGDGNSYYTLTYSDDFKTFTGKNIDTGIETLFTIIEYTEERLVLNSDGADRYFYVSTAAALAAELKLPVIDPSRDELTDINSILNYAYGYTDSPDTPMGVHYTGRHETTESDRNWLSDPTKEPSGVDSFTKWVKKDVKLYPYGKPLPADCNQHSIGDCSAIAVFSSMAYLFPEFIMNIIKDNGDNTYSVSMFDPQGKAVTVSVSNAILCDDYGTIVQCTGKNNAITWSTILEKAMIKYEDIYHVDQIVGIGSEFVAPLFTGDGGSFAFSPNTLYPSEMKKVVEWALSKGKISIGGFTIGNLLCDELYSVVAHAFAFMLTAKSGFLFSMRNPWGIGDTQDGVLNIPDDKSILYTIDMRIINPGAAAKYLTEEVSPYIPPKYKVKPTDLKVSDYLIKTGL
ncbi:MAG: Ig-like domain-containing protein [Bacteroidales bacterium]|nr:Ig-like domain-containing protein [Bacteroidales bacterium]